MSQSQTLADLYKVLDRLLASPLVQIDGGARNGTRDLPRLARYISSYGFEPSPDEYARLTQGTFPVAYQQTKYLPFALLEQSGEATLYITKRPGATSTLHPDNDMLSHFKADNWSQMGEVVGEEKVRGISLSDFMKQEGFTAVDYLKLDTQGNELQILKSAGSLLDSFSVIKTEVEMVPLYTDQPLLGEVCTYLTNKGFQLLDLQWTHACRRFHFSPDLPPNSYRLVWGDAFFARNPFDFAAPRKLEQAIVLAELGYLDLALYIIDNLPTLAPADKQALLNFYQYTSPPTLKGHLKGLVKKYVLRRPDAKPSKQVVRIP